MCILREGKVAPCPPTAWPARPLWRRRASMARVQKRVALVGPPLPVPRATGPPLHSTREAVLGQRPTPVGKLHGGANPYMVQAQKLCNSRATERNAKRLDRVITQGTATNSHGKTSSMYLTPKFQQIHHSNYL
jgi:hypothetical protein